MKPSVKLASCFIALAIMTPSGVAFADVGGERVDGGSTSDDSTIQPHANTTNRKFYFTFSKSGATSNGGESRRKDNTAPVYIRAAVKKCDRCRVYVDRWTGSKWENVVEKSRATLKYANKDCSIRVLSKAQGYKVRLTGWADSTKGDVSGVWSPDSTRTYAVINGD